ncbi:Plasmodium exported protein, unknown function [Plasmodium malariae]|uniref:Fam-m protein n=1 Tax=Plasmodium malariae TaxID=5858 RepID=A0A1D3JGQ8_PLAMA|nr:Plasmodium exported protein, unknown function [Plasmodium malariae]SBT85441.1 Plasmodium exported protein, unknown function [Plasmodium malariae]
MEQKIKLPLFIMICSYIVLSWIYYFNHDMCTFNKYLDGKININGTNDIRICRLLSKHKQAKDPNITWLERNIETIEDYAKSGISNNSTVEKDKNKKTIQCSLNSANHYGRTKKSNSSVYNKGNSHFEKRVLDKIYYKNKVRYFMKADFLFLKNDIKVNKCVICAATICFLIPGIIGAASILYNLSKVTDTFKWICLKE